MFNSENLILNFLFGTFIMNSLKTLPVNENKVNALFEALKLVLRLYVFSIVPIIGSIILMGVNPTTGSITINWMVIRAVFIFETVTFVVAAVDKYKHEYLKSLNPEETEGKSMGIVKF